jgi:hypothetical protein
MPTVTIKLSDWDMRLVRLIARKEVRTVEQQLTYFLLRGIEAYLRGSQRPSRDEEHREDDESSTGEAGTTADGSGNSSDEV